METMTGIFALQNDAETAIRSLRARRFDDSQISLLKPGDASLGTPVHGKTAGAALGGVLGAGASTFLLPGLGPIAGFGLVAASLAGIGLGAAAGAAIDRHTAGIPNEELFFYEETLRGGGAVVFVQAQNADQATQARNILAEAGARTPEAVRREWWQELRGQFDFGRNEPEFRAGFEAALHPATRGQRFEESGAYLEKCYPGPCNTEAFRSGFEQGQEYLRRGRMATAQTH